MPPPEPKAGQSVGNAPPMRPCHAPAKRGACRAFAPAGRDYCFNHDPERAEARQQARSRGATQANKLRAIQGRRARLDSMGALVTFTAGVVQDVLAGSTDKDVGRTVLYGISIQHRLLEATDIERRLTVLEGAQAAQPKGGRRWGA